MNLHVPEEVRNFIFIHVIGQIGQVCDKRRILWYFVDDVVEISRGLWGCRQNHVALGRARIVHICKEKQLKPVQFHTDQASKLPNRDIIYATTVSNAIFIRLEIF
jgi:hypothetical protein